MYKSIVSCESNGPIKKDSKRGCIIYVKVFQIEKVSRQDLTRSVKHNTLYTSEHYEGAAVSYRKPKVCM